MLKSNIIDNGSAISCLIICSLIAFLFITGAPMDGAFYWSDSPRHALNGAFVMDMMKAMPFSDPTGYAYNYYSQYPALTILFYPPLFAFILAPFYAIFGVSQETALLAVYTCYCFFACGVYFLARQQFSKAISLGIALILASTPELTFWGRQVMLEIPSFAFLVWSAYFLIKHIENERISYLYLSIALLVLATYSKLSVVFVAIPYFLVLLQHRRTQLFKDKHSYLIILIALIGMIPLIVLTLKFGQANIQSVTGVDDSRISRTSIMGWLWYATKIPGQIGWPAFIASISGMLVFIFTEKDKKSLLNNNLFFISWFVVGYLFFSSIDLKEERHSIFLLLPVILFIAYTGNYLENIKKWLGVSAIGVIAFATFLYTYQSRPVFYVDGYKDVVEYVSEMAPENSNILFSGYRDGAFIFNMRAHGNRPDVSTVRADKILLRISVRRELGVEEKDFTREEVADKINQLAVHYVVAQPDFWTDIEQMQQLQNLLESDRFEEVKRVKMVSNYNTQEKELVIYKNLGDVAEGPVAITNELPIIEQTVSSGSQ